MNYQPNSHSKIDKSAPFTPLQFPNRHQKDSLATGSSFFHKNNLTGQDLQKVTTMVTHKEVADRMLTNKDPAPSPYIHKHYSNE